MDRLILKDEEYLYYEYSKEAEFEKDVVSNAKKIFGQKEILYNLKSIDEIMPML